MIRGYVIGPEEGLPGPIAGVKASRRFTDGSLTLIESTVDGGSPRHTRLYEDESFYLLDRSLAVESGGDRFTATSGSVVFLPRTLPHTFHSVGGRPGC